MGINGILLVILLFIFFIYIKPSKSICFIWYINITFIGLYLLLLTYNVNN